MLRAVSRQTSGCRLHGQCNSRSYRSRRCPLPAMDDGGSECATVVAVASAMILQIQRQRRQSMELNVSVCARTAPWPAPYIDIGWPSLTSRCAAMPCCAGPVRLAVKRLLRRSDRQSSCCAPRQAGRGSKKARKKACEEGRELREGGRAAQGREAGRLRMSRCRAVVSVATGRPLDAAAPCGRVRRQQPHQLRGGPKTTSHWSSSLMSVTYLV